MTIEYYVKRKVGEQWKIVDTCSTSEQARKHMDTIQKANRGAIYAVFYNQEAIDRFCHNRGVAS